MNTELKSNLLYRWFVRLEQDETINDSFRVALARLRARLASRLKREQWQAFLARTVALALAQHRLLRAAAPPPRQEPPTGKGPSQKPAPPKKKLPRSYGDPDAYWITKKRRGVAGRITETTLGYEVGFFSTQSQGIITGVVVREAAQANRTEFTHWVDQYQQDWKLGRGQLEVSADGEYHTGDILRHFEQQGQRLCVPVSEPKVPKGKLDHRYFSYFAAEDLYVCHEGAELKRIGHDKQRQRTRYRAREAGR